MFLSFHFAISSSLFTLPSVSCSKLQLMNVAGKANSVSYIGYSLDRCMDNGVDCWRPHEIFPFSKSPVWPCGPMSFLPNGSHGLLLWGVKQPQHKPNQTPQSTAKVKNACSLSSISPSCCGVSEHEHMHRKHEYIYMHTHKYLRLFNCWEGKTKDDAEYMRKDKCREQRQADSPTQILFFQYIPPPRKIKKRKKKKKIKNKINIT
jgi:hypothetical protein